MKNPYEDIIHLPHHVSATRPQMSIENRAAQFSPFAALTGHDSAIKETARITEKKIELSDNMIEKLNAKIQVLKDNIDVQPQISVTYFQRDVRKDGGEYVTAKGTVKKIDDYEQIIVFVDKSEIAIGDVLDIKCELFGQYEIE